MATINIHNQQAEVVGSMELPSRIFDVEPKPALIHEVVVIQAANSRSVLAHTKGRGEVRGGGKKPWKQKGTGRARHGSSRSPIWVGGGITFGPTNEREFSRKLNKRIKQQVLAMILTDKLRSGSLRIVDSLAFPEQKTRRVASLLNQFGFPEKKVLFISEPTNADIHLVSRNIPSVQAISIKSLNAVDLLSCGYAVFSTSAIEYLNSVMMTA